MRVIVIGTSHAGIGFVDAMRRNGFDGELVLLDALVGQPLERPPLSKAFLSADGKDNGRFLLRKPDWFAENDIKLVDGCRVTALHPDAWQVETASGERMSYDRLVLAMGATPRRLPATDGMNGVFELRHPVDAARLRSAAVKASSAIVIGGGVYRAGSGGDAGEDRQRCHRDRSRAKVGGAGGEPGDIRLVCGSSCRCWNNGDLGCRN